MTQVDAPGGAQASSGVDSASAEPRPASGRPEILLAEDDEHIARLVQFKLSKAGFQVHLARHGGEAIESLGARPWAAVVLDLMMPVHDGWEVLEALKRMPRGAEIPVLLLTAKGDVQVMENAGERGGCLRAPST